MMEFEPGKATLILERTPSVLKELLAGLPPDWTHQNEGEETWSPYDVIGHLIHGEETDWIPRAEIILGDGSNKTFEPFDRFAQFEKSEGKTLQQLLDEFETLRAQSLKKLSSFNLTEEDLRRTGMHPELGEVTLKQLLATWVTHDLGHIVQISRVMAKQYKTEVGPWKKYISVINP